MTHTQAQEILKDLAETAYNVPRRSDPISMRKNQIYEAIMIICQPYHGDDDEYHWRHPGHGNYCLNCDHHYDDHDDLMCP